MIKMNKPLILLQFVIIITYQVLYHYSLAPFSSQVISLILFAFSLIVIQPDDTKNFFKIINKFVKNISYFSCVVAF